MRINLGIIGYPLGHTLSPAIHAYFLEKAGLIGGYSCFEEQDAAIIGDLIGFVRRYSFKGLNVTVPHKVAVMEHCDVIDDDAAKVGAVNTLYFTKERMEGYNTDVYGFSRMLLEEGIATSGKSVLIIGAGGAARAVVSHINSYQPNRLAIANRTLANTIELAKLSDVSCDCGTPQEFSGQKFDIIINTTSLGLKGETFPDYGIECSEAAVDLQYQNEITPFLNVYSNKGVKLLNGFKMLVYQAYRSFNIWTGAEFELDTEELYKLQKNKRLRISPQPKN